MDCAKWCAVHFFGAIQQPKMHAKLLVQRFRIAAHNLQTAALGWPFRPEGTDDHISSRLHCARHLSNVGETVARGGEEVKDSPVAPHVVSRELQLDLSDVPTSQWTRSEAFPSRFLFASMAVCEISRTVRVLYPRV